MSVNAALLVSALLMLAATGPLHAEPAPRMLLDDPETEVGLTSLQTLALIGQVVRLRFLSQNIPSAQFGPANVERWSPELRLRVRFPITKKSVGQVVGRFRSDRYGVHGVGLFGPQDPLGDGTQQFYTAALNLEGAYEVDAMPKLFNQNEVWSAVGGLLWRSRWQGTAFDQGMTGGGYVAFAYALPRSLRLVLGISVRTRLGRSGVVVRPTGALLWQVTDRWRIRNRRVGAQVEYQLANRIRLFAAAYRSTSKFVLDRDVPLDDPLVFRDRPAVLVGGGVNWRLTKHIQLITEGGLVVSRELRVRSGDNDGFTTGTAPTHGYFELRVIAGG